MAQTFDELYRTRQRRRVGGMFGWMLRMFLETFLGILTEYILTIQARSSMQNISSIAQAGRAGVTFLAHPVNVVFAVAIFALLATIVGAIILDQYPCWIGVPNCD